MTNHAFPPATRLAAHFSSTRARRAAVVRSGWGSGVRDGSVRYAHRAGTSAAVGGRRVRRGVGMWKGWVPGLGAARVGGGGGVDVVVVVVGEEDMVVVVVVCVLYTLLR